MGIIIQSCEYFHSARLNPYLCCSEPRIPVSKTLLLSGLLQPVQKQISVFLALLLKFDLVYRIILSNKPIYTYFCRLASFKILLVRENRNYSASHPKNNFISLTRWISLYLYASERRSMSIFVSWRFSNVLSLVWNHSKQFRWFLDCFKRSICARLVGLMPLFSTFQ